MACRRERLLSPDSLVFRLLSVLCLSSILHFAATLAKAQIETVENTSQPQFVWLSHGRVEGHLALNSSPAGAFSPDSRFLAVASGEKIVLMDLRGGRVEKTLHPRVEGVSDLSIHSANYVNSNRLFVMANGLARAKPKEAAVPTPTLGFLWDPDLDALAGKVNAFGTGGGYGAPHFFPMIGYLALYKDTNFDLWRPLTRQGGRITVPALTRQPNLYEFSPDGHWLLLAQIESSGTADPVVVDAREHKFVDSLRGHQGTVLSMGFSRDDKKALTTCEDGKVRIWSVGDWKLLKTLSGHQGAVHWAEFSADGQWIVSGGEDKTVRVWSAEDGSLQQTLEESKAPILTVAFSPDGEYIAAGAEDLVLVWHKTKQ